MADFLGMTGATDGIRAMHQRVTVSRAGRVMVQYTVSASQTSLSIASVVVVSPTQLTVNFNANAKNNPALATKENYTIDGGLEVLSVTIPSYSGSGPAYVTLETGEQIDSYSYTLTIHNIEGA